MMRGPAGKLLDVALVTALDAGIIIVRAVNRLASRIVR